MELRVLKYFLTVANEGNITNAANTLHITQPTLSRQIMDLEEEMHQKLLIRSSHSVSLTPEGMVLRKRAEEILDMVAKVKAEVQAQSEDVSGDIFIGGGETQGIRTIAEVIGIMRKKFPRIRYHFHSGNSQDVCERLDKGLIDFGILLQPADITKYEYMKLPTKDVWGVVMANDMPLAEKSRICKEDLFEKPLICSRQVIQKTAIHNQFIEWFGSDFEKLNIVVTYNLVFNAALLAEKKIGYLLTIDKLINNMDMHNLVFRPLYPSLDLGLLLVWKKHQLMSPAANIFMQELKNHISESNYG